MEKIIVEVVVVIYTLCLAVPRFISYDHVVFKRKFAIVFVFYHFTKEMKPTPTSSRQTTSALRWVFHRKRNYLTQRFATNRTQLTKTTVKTRIQEPMFLTRGCVWKEPGRIFGNLWKTKKADSFAVMSNNHHDKTQLHQTQMSVIDLEKRLKAAASTTNVHLFPGNTNCARNNKIL